MVFDLLHVVPGGLKVTLDSKEKSTVLPKLACRLTGTQHKTLDDRFYIKRCLLGSLRLSPLHNIYPGIRSTCNWPVPAVLHAG